MENTTVLTPKDLQSILKIGRVRAYELFNSADFPSFKIGKRLFVNRSRFEDWMREKEAEGEK